MTVWDANGPGFRAIARIHEGEEKLLSCVSVIPVPDPALSFFHPAHHARSEMLRDFVGAVRGCKRSLKVGIRIFFLRGSRGSPPLKRHDALLSITDATVLEPNCMYTDVDVQAPERQKR